MPKKRRTAKPAARRKAGKGHPLWKGFFSFITSPPVRRLILVGIAVGLVYWFWFAITNWAVTTWENLLQHLGVGLGLAAAALAIAVWIIWRGKFSLLIHHWNRWLGGISLALAAWGLLAFFAPGSGILSKATLGGEFGKSIITASDTMGALRLLGLTALGIMFLAPLWTWSLIANIAKAIGRVLRGAWQALSKASQPRPKATPEPAPIPIEFEKAQPTKVEAEEEATPAPSPVSPEAGEVPAPETREPAKYQPVLTAGGWQLPPIGILDKPAEVELSQTDIQERAKLIAEALGSYGVEAKVVQINTGPTVTQFGVEPGWDRKYKEIKERDKDGNVKVRSEEISKTRVKVERISSLASDLALALAAPSIRIEAPIPGKSVVGIEVPNTTFGLVNLRSVIETPAFQKINAKSNLALAMGKGAGGETVAADLARMPHLLVAGSTGSGKTACLNSTICSLLLHNTPDDVQFVMIDPKRVELVNFNNLPHLVAPVVVDTDKALMALRWLNLEMDNRYRKFAQVGARNIEGYNKSRQLGEGLPFIVLVIDELADLMMTSFDEVEHLLCRLAQLARATGIHLIVATQRPSVDVVTGLIKANFPTRISFALTSQVDSRTILDSAGAEKLLGRGDMLYMPTDASKPKRLQGTFVSDPEVERLVQFWGSQRRPEAEPLRFEEMTHLVSAQKGADDSLLEAARQLAQEHGSISTSFLQRRLRIGYPRAARLSDKLKEDGYGETATE
ncbi:MAG: DNA translocase FtsK [Dehalococcoidia bacterium]|nr:DNA translocase FtsK [Dehalococcoidia bacterium]